MYNFINSSIIKRYKGHFFMHKLVQRKICLFLFIAASLFTSCSFFDNSLENNLSASVSFQINGIKSRSATI